MIDFSEELSTALSHPKVAAALAQHLKPLIAEALAEQGKAQADAWLTAKEAARYLYGAEGKEEAFRALRNRHPELDQHSNGMPGKRRRWKRSDLDQATEGNQRLRKDR